MNTEQPKRFLTAKEILARYTNNEALNGSLFEKMLDDILSRIAGKSPSFEYYEWFPQHEDLEHVLFSGYSIVNGESLSVKIQEIETPMGISFKCFQYSESALPDFVIHIDATGHPVDAEMFCGLKLTLPPRPRKP